MTIMTSGTCSREKGSTYLSVPVALRMENHVVACRQRRRRRLQSRSSAATAATAAALLIFAAITPYTTMLMVEAQSMEGGSSSSSGSNSLSCGGLKCLNNATCRHANGDDSYFCDCPAGFADVDCGRVVRECHYVAGDRSITAECYNGGTCLPELYIVHHNDNNGNNAKNDEPLCDCSAATYQGQRYVGKYCEMPLDDKSMCSSSTAEGDDDGEMIADRHFCLHGGTCRDTNGVQNCDCATGFRGPHCEFAVQLYDNPACDLTCENGGVCNFGGGSSTPSGSGGSSGLLQKQEHGTSWGSRGEQHCLCPVGFAGVQCEHVVEVCSGQQAENGSANQSGNNNNNNTGVCLYGSTCDYGKDEKKYNCACPVNDQNYMGGTCKKSSGGGSTTRSRMELCNPSTPGVAEYAFGMAVPAFCVNGGKCKDVIMDDNQVYVS
jgi:hypothetical protein